MNVTNITDDYDNITDLIFTNKCTINENNFDKFMPSILLAIPCGLSFLCLMNLMVYTVIKLLLTQ